MKKLLLFLALGAAAFAQNVPPFAPVTLTVASALTPQTGVTTIAGTSGQVLVNGATTAVSGAVTLSLPTAITGVNSITAAASMDLTLNAGSGTGQNVNLISGSAGYVSIPNTGAGLACSNYVSYSGPITFAVPSGGLNFTGVGHTTTFAGPITQSGSYSITPGSGGYYSNDGTQGLTQASTTTLGKSITVKNGLVVLFQ